MAEKKREMFETTPRQRVNMKYWGRAEKTRKVLMDGGALSGDSEWDEKKEAFDTVTHQLGKDWAGSTEVEKQTEA